MFDQTTGHHDLAKLTNKISRHIHSLLCTSPGKQLLVLSPVSCKPWQRKEQGLTAQGELRSGRSAGRVCAPGDCEAQREGVPSRELEEEAGAPVSRIQGLLEVAPAGVLGGKSWVRGPKD